jgi:hypothetical protein
LPVTMKGRHGSFGSAVLAAPPLATQKSCRKVAEDCTIK